MHAQSTLTQFLDDLAARAPTPGGGSASAVGGALGAALGSMAAVYTCGNEKFKHVEAQAAALDKSFAALRLKFLDLMQQDVDAYAAYSSARALPRATPEEKQARKAAMDASNEAATIVPLKIGAACEDGIRFVEELSAIVNPNLAGDVASSAYFLEAAARGAAIQVFSNCATDDITGVNAARRADAKGFVNRCQNARERIHETVLKFLKVPA